MGISRDEVALCPIPGVAWPPQENAPSVKGKKDGPWGHGGRLQRRSSLRGRGWAPQGDAGKTPASKAHAEGQEEASPGGCGEVGAQKPPREMREGKCPRDPGLRVAFASP